MHVYWYSLSVFCCILYAFEFNTSSLRYVTREGNVLLDFSQKLCQTMSALFLQAVDSNEK